jgi:dihydroflavonol-4-reductase
VLALEHGRPGERYLLGGNYLTLRELFAAVADLAGRPRPRVPVPYPAIRAGAVLGLVNRNEAILARTAAYFSSAKAERELGYRAATTWADAIPRQVEWLIAVAGGRDWREVLTRGANYLTFDYEAEDAVVAHVNA